MKVWRSMNLSLGFGFTFEELHGRDGLVRLDRCFVDELSRRDLDLHNRLMAARAEPERMAGKTESALLVALAPQLEDFVAELFGITPQTAALTARQQALAPLYSVKRLFGQR